MWKFRRKNEFEQRVLRRFIRLVIFINDTPLLIRFVAADAYHLRICEAVVGLRSDPVAKSDHLDSIVQAVKRECALQNIAFDHLLKKLSPVARVLWQKDVYPPILPDYYQSLGVSSGADPAAIKTAYRAKARITHPDTATGNGDAFMSVQKAYQVLSDDELKKQYDSIVGNNEGIWMEGLSGWKRALKPIAYGPFGFTLTILLILFLLFTAILVVDFIYQQLSIP